MKTLILDQLIELGQGPIRSLDCVIAQKVSEFPEKDSLSKNILKAQEVFPKTSSCNVLIERVRSLESFSNDPLPSPTTLIVGLVTEEGKNYLALKMSHLLGDAISMLQWLNVLHTGIGRAQDLQLRSFPKKKDTPYRHFRRSEVWMKQKEISSQRKIEKKVLTHPHKFQKISLNDILILSFLRSLPYKWKSIWLPVNVREHFGQGFGNGLSRMRIYSPSGLSTKTDLEEIRKQKKEAFHNGEVALPPMDLDLSSPVRKKIFTLWLNRPWADWSSLSLSHLHDKENLSPSSELWGVTNLIPRHFGGVFAYTKEDRTYLTLTYDSLVQKEHACNLLNAVSHNFEGILNELKV